MAKKSSNRVDLRLALAVLCSCWSVGACLSDVDYLRAGNQVAPSGGSSGASQGGTGAEGATDTGGTFAAGGTDEAGTAGQGMAGKGESGGGMGGSSGSAGSATGGMGGMVVGRCGNPRIVETFQFEDSDLVVDTSVGTIKEHWVKGPYDSTDTGTGLVDSTANPPGNPLNLANLSKLDVDADAGDAKPSMRFTIPFSPTPRAAEHVHLLYIFAGYGEPQNTVNFSKATLTASATLQQAPNDNCIISANAWTTGTDAPGHAFLHVDGPKVNLSVGKWVTIQMNLATSNPPTAVNQFGFALHSTCSKPTNTGDGGAGGLGAGGAAGEGGPTVVLIDKVLTHCP